MLKDMSKVQEDKNNYNIALLFKSQVIQIIYGHQATRQRCSRHFYKAITRSHNVAASQHNCRVANIK